MTEETFTIETIITAPVETVWTALRDPEQIKRWHGWQFDGLDEEVEQIYFTRAQADDAEHRLVIEGSDTFTLTDLGGRTLLRMVRGPYGANPEWDPYYQDINEGWTTFIPQLRLAVERHPGEDRRTLQLSRDGSTGHAQAINHLVDGLGVGAPYDILAPTGDRLTGTVWFRSEHQVGLTVEDWNDGLLVTGLAPASPIHPEGGEMLVLTTYGLTEAEHAELARSWTDWWS
jgi:hypothetical protein